MKSLTRNTNETTTQRVHGVPWDSQGDTQATYTTVRAPDTEARRWSPALSAYATDHLFAVLADDRATRRATEALLAHGYTLADIHTYSGPAQARQLEEQEQRRGVVRFFRAVQEAFTYDAHTSRTRYMQALCQGKSVVMVYCPTDGEVQRAADLLAGEGARHLVYYGRWNIQLVSPQVTVTTGKPREPRS